MNRKRALFSCKLVLYFFLLFRFLSSCKPPITEEDIVQHFTLERLNSYDTPTSVRYAQGMDIYDCLVFQSFSDGTIDVFNLSSLTFLQTLYLPKDSFGEPYHCNDIYIDEDEFGLLLWVPSNRTNGPHVGIRMTIDNGVFSFGDSITIPSPQVEAVDYKGITHFVGNSSYCVLSAYERTVDDGFGDVMIKGYDYDGLFEGVSYTEQWEIHHDRLWAMQGGCFCGDFFYMAVGVSHGDAKIYRIDLSTGLMECFLDFRDRIISIPSKEEIQGVSIFDGSLYISTTYGLYRCIYN